MADYIPLTDDGLEQCNLIREVVQEITSHGLNCEVSRHTGLNCELV